MGGMFDRTEAPAEELPTFPAKEPTRAKPAATATPPTPPPMAEPAQPVPDHILEALAAELRRGGLSGHDLDTAITAFAVARATQEAERAQRRDRRDWSKVAQEHGRPQTFRLWQTTIDRLAALHDERERHNPRVLKRDLVNALLVYALDAVDAGELDLSDL